MDWEYLESHNNVYFIYDNKLILLCRAGIYIFTTDDVTTKSLSRCYTHLRDDVIINNMDTYSPADITDDEIREILGQSQEQIYIPGGYLSYKRYWDILDAYLNI